MLKAEGVSHSDVIVGIHIGSNENAICKRWPKERFAKLADRLIKERGIKPIFVGTPSEVEDIEETIRLMNSTAVNAAGKSNLKQLAAILGRCDLFIGNDSAPMHIAAAMDTPTIGLYGPSSPLRFAPLGKEHSQIYRDVGCNPCNIPHLGKIPKCTENRCMTAISVDDVMTVVNSHHYLTIQEMTPLGEK
jgi:ADP-heptose:LPS heptosyltransferase